MNPVREVLLGIREIFKKLLMIITYTKSNILRKRLYITKASYLNSRILTSLTRKVATSASFL